MSRKTALREREQLGRAVERRWLWNATHLLCGEAMRQSCSFSTSGPSSPWL